MSYEYDCEKPILIVGSDGSSSGELRLYAYGGFIGKINIQEEDFLLNNEFKDKYLKYLQTSCIFKRKGKYGYYQEEINNELNYLICKYPEINVNEYKEICLGKKPEILVVPQKLEDLSNNRLFLDLLVTA